MNGMTTYIYAKRNEIERLKNEIERLKAEIFKAQCKRWEDLYKDRCKEYFLTLEEFMAAIEFDNHIDDRDVDNLISFRESCLEEATEVSIKTVLTEMKNHNLKFIPNKIARMICEACSCQNCKFIKEHLGHTCQDCIDSNYLHYSGYCDE